MRLFSLLSVIVVLTFQSTGMCKSARRGTIRASDANDLKEKDNSIATPTNPYDELAQFLLRESSHYRGKSSKKRKVRDGDDGDDDCDFSVYNQKEIVKAIKQLTSSQSALKTFDGATHQFRNTFKDTSSLSARYSRFMSSDRENLKEASKVLEYVTTVERALHSIEVILGVKCSDSNDRMRQLANAGLTEMSRVILCRNKVNCILSILSPIPVDTGDDVGSATSINGSSGRRKAGKNAKGKTKKYEIKKYEDNELIVVITGDSDTNTDIAQALRVMSQDADHLSLKSVGLLREEVAIQPTILQLAVDAMAELKQYLHAPLSATNNNTSSSLTSNSTNHTAMHATNSVAFHNASSIRIMGHSTGGAVGAYVAMILDGSLNTTSKILSHLQPYFGLYHKAVKCITLGSPPCISRTVIPRYVSSIVCGDDIVSRASPESIKSMKNRVFKALKSGAGKSLWMGFINDLTDVAGKGLGKYTGSSHDLVNLSVPGRVFFVKSRKHKQGSSIQRVFRGNWQEAMLWSLHDILLSKRMIDHHELSSYFQTLMRC